MLRFRIYPIVEKNLVRVHVDQQLVLKNHVTFLRCHSEIAIKGSLDVKSSCPQKLTSFYLAVSRLDGATGEVTIYPSAFDIAYRNDCFEKDLSVWIQEALKLLSKDGKIEPMKEAVPQNVKKRLRYG